MFYFNTLNLNQISGGNQVKQGDFGSTFTYNLADEKGRELDVFDQKKAYVNLVLDNNIVFTTTVIVGGSTVTFNIDKAIPTGLYFLEIKIDNYIFPSDRQTIVLVTSGAVAYDLKELVPNYDTNMTITGILSDLSQKGIDINEITAQLQQTKQELSSQLAQKPYQYNSLSDMKSDNRLINGMSAITLGYTNPKGGGGGTYKIQSTSTKQANNGNVVALNNGNFAILQTEPYIYRVEQWGGSPSQLCDTALENIIKDAKENNEGFTIIFGYGFYNFELNHVIDKRVTIEGKGVENTTLNFIGIDTDNPFITIGSDKRIASVSIRDIRLKGNNKYKTGLKLVKTSAKTELTNVRIVEFKKEGLLAMGVYDANVNNLEMADCGGLLEGNYYYGLTMTNSGNDNSNAWHVVNSRFERSPYMVKAFKTFSMQMTNCKFEAGDGVNLNDGNQPYILVDSPNYPFIFNACSFVATSVERIRSLKGDVAFIPSHMIEVKNTSLNAPVSLTACEFLSATHGALFIRGSRVIVCACTFNLTNGQMGDLYSIDLQDNSILSHSRIHVLQSQEGGLIPIFCNNGIVKDNVISMWTRSGVPIVGKNSAVAIPLGTPSNRIDNLTTQHGLQFTEV